MKTVAMHLEVDSLEARLGLRLGAALSERAERSPHDISERLRFARETALQKATQARQAQTAPGVSVLANGRPGVAVLGDQPQWLIWLGSLIPLLLLLAGLVLIDEWHDRAQTIATADVDTALLADELPPDAYSDPGFVEFLRAQHD